MSEITSINKILVTSRSCFGCLRYSEDIMITCLYDEGVTNIYLTEKQVNELIASLTKTLAY